MITSSEVHIAIQQMDGNLQGYDHSIAIDAIAENLHVAASELLPHLDALYNLRYIKYADSSNSKIKLTFNGMFTIPPQMELFHS
jgi:hypothetical protein